MKLIKNDRASYKTRAVIGGAKSLSDTSKAKNRERTDFRVDSCGYFIWQGSNKPAGRK